MVPHGEAWGTTGRVLCWQLEIGVAKRATYHSWETGDAREPRSDAVAGGLNADAAGGLRERPAGRRGDRGGRGRAGGGRRCRRRPARRGPFALARDKLDRARTAAAAGENFEAARLAEQALVDAQLAAAEARSEVAREHAAALRASIEQLRATVIRVPTS